MKFCECNADGHCQRYGREMVGRFREICAGTNVDLGTAAAFREQWLRENPHKPCAGPPMRLLLKTDQAPGDAVAMTAAIYSLHKAHPGKFITAVDSPYPEVFAHNPDVVPAAPGMAELRMHYPAIHDSNIRGIHFMAALCEHLEAALGVRVPLLTNRPHLYCDPYDYDDPPVEDMWIVCSGGKRDFTCKLWGHWRYEQVVHLLKGRVRFVQVGKVGDDHPLLDGAEWRHTHNLRHLFNLVRHAMGVLCGVSLLMHIAAALEKPCVVVAGGREPVQWNSYPKQTYLHTVGALSCATSQGHVGGACWRSRVISLGDGTALDKDTCLYPQGNVPRCMELITPQEVVATVLRMSAATSSGLGARL